MSEGGNHNEKRQPSGSESRVKKRDTEVRACTYAYLHVLMHIFHRIAMQDTMNNLTLNFKTLKSKYQHQAYQGSLHLDMNVLNEYIRIRLCIANSENERHTMRSSFRKLISKWNTNVKST